MDPTQIPLRDLHLPADIGWWPLAPGWWLLIALALVGLFLLMRRAWRRYRRSAHRRIALRALKRLRAQYEEGADAVTLAVELSELLRRAMLAYAPRNEVAGLTGEAWLRWLDRGLDGKPFTSGPGRDIESLPYRARAQVGDDVDVHGLILAVRQRLQTPLPEGTA